MTHRIRRGLALASLVAVALAGVLVVGTGAGAVSRGTPTQSGAYRFAARLVVGTYSSCSGVLVDPGWLLTARSCFADRGQELMAGPPPHPTTAIVGRADGVTTGGHVLRVMELVPRADRDVVLARLASRISDIAPIALGAAPTVGETLRVGGFGRTATEWVPDRLFSAGFRVQAVGATTVDVTGQDPADTALCQGDAGGPAFRETSGQVELVALTSTSLQGGCLAETETRTDATQARVDDLGGWIRQIVPALVPQSQMTVRSADTQETASGNFRATNVLDGNPATLWHSRFTGGIAALPHEIQLDLGATRTVSDLFYLPRQDASPNGRIGRYEVYVSADGTNWGAPVAAGTMPNTTAEQQLRFVPKPGRYVRLRALSEVAGAQYTTVAELNVGVVAGVPSMTVRSADSEETASGNYRATNALDGNPATLWHTRYSGTAAPLPHEIQLDLGASYPVTDVYYLPRQDASPNGRIARYEVYVSTDGATWGSPVATGTWANSTALQVARFPAVAGRYVRLRALSEVAGNQLTSAAEVGVGIARAGIAANVAVRSVDSEETSAANYRATNALDGNPATLWHTRYSGAVAPLPHEIQLDLRATYPVTELHYLPRQDASPNGRIGNYEVYVSTDPTAWGSPVATGTWANSTALQVARFPAVAGRYVRLRALSEVAGNQLTSAAEITIGLAAFVSQTRPGAVATPGADDETSAVESFDHPNAAQILAQHDLRLFDGDGHIVFVTSHRFDEDRQCAADQIQVEKWFAEEPFGVYYCFRTIGGQGYLALEVPGTFGVRGGNVALRATAELPEGERTFAINPAQFVPISPGTGSEPPAAVLVELRLAP